MEPDQERSLIPLPPRELTVPLAAPNRILGEMVEQSLALAKETVPETVDLDALVQEGKRVRRREGMTPEDVRAFQLFYQAAKAGHAEAQYLVSCCYVNGLGVAENCDKALEWHKRSAESGYAAAQFYLGMDYRLGSGVPRDFDEAKKWIRRAAEGGHADAQCDMGEYCSEVLENCDEAAKWYRLAAAQGNAKGQFELGLYLSGGGKDAPSVVGRIRSKLMGWFFHDQVEEAVAGLFEGKELLFDVVSGITGEVIVPARQKITRSSVMVVVDESIAGGVAPALMRDAIHEVINGLRRKAVELFRASAEQGCLGAQRNLALCLESGDGVEMDVPRAYAWFSLLSDEYSELAAKIRSEGQRPLTSDKQAEDALNEANRLALKMSSSGLEIGRFLHREFKRIYSAKL